MIEKLKNWWRAPEGELESGNDAVFSSVAPNKRRNTFTLWVVAICYAYTVTAFIVGGTLLTAASSKSYWMDMIIGYSVLMVFSLLVSIPGYRTGCNTTIFMRYVYGKNGYLAPMILVALLNLLHVGFQCSTFAEVLFPMGSIQFKLVAVVCGCMVAWSIAKGIKGLETASKISIAFLFVAGGFCIYFMFQDVGGLAGFNAVLDGVKLNVNNETYLINTVIGSWTIGATMNANYARFCKNGIAMVGFCFFCFFFVQIILAVLGTLGVMTVDSYLFTVYAPRISFIFSIFVTIAFLLALWTTMNTSLYLGQIPFATITKARFSSTGVVMAIAMTIMGVFEFSRFATPILNICGVLLPPFIAPMIIDYYLNSKYYFYKPEIMVKKLPKYNWVAFVSAISALIISTIYLPSFMPEAIWVIILSGIIYFVLFFVLRVTKKTAGISSVVIDDELKNNTIPFYTSKLQKKSSTVAENMNAS